MYDENDKEKVMLSLDKRSFDLTILKLTISKVDCNCLIVLKRFTQYMPFNLII